LKGAVHIATIKEVAAAAGVSLGTASNVINGKTKNEDLIKKVEEAIRQLDFRPDAKARSLKSAQTYLIGVIVDSINDQNTQQLLSSLERQFRSKGYSIVLRTSGNNAVLESKNVEYFIQLGVDGIIVSTSQNKKAWFKKLNVENLPIVFITKTNYNQNDMDVICINHTHAVQQLFTWCKAKNLKKTGFILDMASVSIKDLERIAKNNRVEIIYKLVGDHSSESGFKAAYELLYEHPEIDNLVIGSSILAKGVQKVLTIKDIKEDLALICVTLENWIDNDGIYDGIIELSDYEIGRIASNRLLEKIDQKDIIQTNIITVYSEFKEKKTSISNYIQVEQNVNKTINIALLESDTANVLKTLTEVYEKRAGININFYFFEYFDLWELIHNPTELLKMDIDIVMFDILWKDNLVENGLLKDITFLQKEDPEYFEDYIDNITDNICAFEDKLYGLPFMTGTQLLMYQKDLFEDNLFKIQFRRLNGYELEVPKTWDEFNLVAEFFTKSYHEKSPVSYGSVLINEGNLYNSIDFLNRLWTYEGSNILNKDDSLKNTRRLALENYKKTFRYSNQGDNFSDLEDVANAFKKGDVAMVILYDSFAFGINDAMVSKVAGNVGSAMIPGGNPVLGGWGLGLMNPGKSIDNTVLSYLKWSCGPQIAEPFSTLAGTSSRKSFYVNKESTGLYPWKDQILNSYSRSRKRQGVIVNGRFMNNIKLYHELIGNELGQFISGKITADDVISTLEEIEANPEIFI
jgi:DNA-binding LacI/PurR family transcriptional regulator/ABC-type glycerol-3-phosphate transport system substrate-binding protein